MRTHVEFLSNKFPAYEGEEEEINPGVWGKRLAEYLQEQLHKHGISTGELFSEDWGWCVPIEHEVFPMWLGCSHYEEYPNGYLIFIEPSKPEIRKNLFKKIDTRVEVEKIAEALNTILTTDPDIKNVRWWEEGG